MTGHPHESTISSAMEDQVSLPVIRQSRFMDLPPEMRMMIYKEFSTLDGVIQSCSRGQTWAARTVELHRDGGINGSAQHSPFDSTQCSLWSVSKAIRSESIPAFFRYNKFHFDNLDLVHDFLSSIGTESRRALTHISFNYGGGAPARATKLLNECVGLREMAIRLNDRTFSNLSLSWVVDFDLMKLYGLRDLLKVRGIERLDITADDTVRQYFHINIPTLEAALQVLKQPRKPAQLKRQYDKDYPPPKATRATFGKTNFTTRMDKKTQSTPAP